MVYFAIHCQNPQRRVLEKAVDILKNKDGICVYPTDTVYGMGAAASNAAAINKICRLIAKDKTRSFSYICGDFSQISQYARVSNEHFRLLKRYLPGPFTFILPATNYVPKKVCSKRKTVGIRLPDNIVCIELVKMLGEPLANTSLTLAGQFRGDPVTVRAAALHEVDIMLDCGELPQPVGSTIVDLTGPEPVVVRHGKGLWKE
ncbi:MAG: L-threonylcarbamoyladenylate synthase [Chitinivibrionales bacterium]|nr:L-threonylcarbamoyladenylate synthase [Chitinivibrionales bacterium]